MTSELEPNNLLPVLKRSGYTLKPSRANQLQSYDNELSRISEIYYQEFLTHLYPSIDALKPKKWLQSRTNYVKWSDKIPPWQFNFRSIFNRQKSVTEIQRFRMNIVNEDDHAETANIDCQLTTNRLAKVVIQWSTEGHDKFINHLNSISNNNTFADYFNAKDDDYAYDLPQTQVEFNLTKPHLEYWLQSNRGIFSSGYRSQFQFDKNISQLIRTEDVFDVMGREINLSHFKSLSVDAFLAMVQSGLALFPF